MTAHTGQLNALFDAKDMKYYFINFHFLSSGYFPFRCWALLEKAEPFLCPHAVIPLTAHLWAQIVKGDSSIAASSFSKPYLDDIGLA